MSREIKFRAWDKQDKKMVIPPSCYLGAGSGAKLIAIGLDGDITLPNAYGLPDGSDPTATADRLELMQFTGLTDKNGVEIYKGDIIQYKEYYANIKWWSTTEEIPLIKKETQRKREDYNISKSDVVFRRGLFQLRDGVEIHQGVVFSSGSSHNCDYEYKKWDFEVIGNIYENPNLLINEE